MANLENESSRKRVQLQGTEETWATMRWVVLLVFLLNWCAWLAFTVRHWEQISHTSAVVSDLGLLVFSPFPCVLMFRRREIYSPSAALFTYILLGMAFSAGLGK